MENSNILTPNISVLMSVYKNDNPVFLNLALESLSQQDYKANQYVLVKDGPVCAELDDVLKKFQANNQGVDIVELGTNVGLADALQIGLKYVKNELVARMDSDDYSVNERFKKQIEIFSHNPEISVVSSDVAEFTDNIDQTDKVRALPMENNELLKFAQWRNPLNHPAVMFKKSAVLSVGGYQTFDKFEDYHLWVRMLVAGFEFFNISETLVLMRTGTGMYSRRGGWKYLLDYISLRKIFVSWGFSTPGQAMMSISLMIANVAIPTRLRSMLYQILLRKSI
ncbi:glycosyltransferase [Weissella confusa]